MVFFFQRGDAKLTSETRLNPDGPGHQLVVTETGNTHTESFDELPKLLARKHELRQAWRAQGWRDVGLPKKTPVDPWPGRQLTTSARPLVGRGLDAERPTTSQEDVR